MRRVISIASFAGLLVLSPVAANAGFTAMGVGTTTCADFGQRYAKDPRLIEQVFFSWAQGMLSGMNQVFIAQHGQTRNLESVGIDIQKAALRNYCKAHPNMVYLGAVMALYLSLAKNPPPAPGKQ